MRTRTEPSGEGAVGTFISDLSHVAIHHASRVAYDFARPQVSALHLSPPSSSDSAKMLASRTLTGTARVATKGSQVRQMTRRTTFSSLPARQAFRRYASAAPTAAFAGQKGANVSYLFLPSYGT